MSAADLAAGDTVIVRWGAARVSRGLVLRTEPDRLVLRAGNVTEVIPAHSIKAATVVAAGRAA